MPRPRLSSPLFSSIITVQTMAPVEPVPNPFPAYPMLYPSFVGVKSPTLLVIVPIGPPHLKIYLFSFSFSFSFLTGLLTGQTANYLLS